MEVKTHRVGTPYIHVEGIGAFPCVEISYRVQVDGLHAASVRLPSGVSVVNGETAGVSVEDLRKILERVEGTAQDLVPCEITEYSEPDEYSLGTGGYTATTIFKGFITQAALVYSADPNAVAGLRLDCFGPAAVLLKRNVNAYIETTIGDFAGRVTGAQQAVDIAAALKSGNSYTAQGGVENVRTPFIQQAQNTSLNVSELLALAVAHVCNALRIDSNKSFDAVEPDKEVLNALGGKVAVALSADEGLTLYAYLSELFDEVLSGMLRGNILQALQSVVNSGKLLLHLIPRWHLDKGNDFKLEVAPCRAWSSEDSVYLKASHVLGLSTQYNAAGALDTPDIVLVRFNQAFAYSYGTAGTGSLFADYGVACLDTALEEQLRGLLRGGAGLSTSGLSSTVRVKTTEAPSWLVGTLSTGTATTADAIDRNNNKRLEIEKTPKGVEDENGRQVTITRDANSALFKQADDIAKTLFMDTYMDTNAVTLNLDPALRFGLCTEDSVFLEENLGRVVTVDLSGSAVNGLSGLLLRGELCDILYSARFDATPSARYSVRLRKVRYVNKTGESALGYASVYDKLAADPCPLYKDA